MDREYATQCIYKGAYTYLRAFAQATCMELHRENGIEWICPRPGASGPSLVYGANFGEGDAGRAIDELIPGIRAGRVPSLWFHSPDWKPGNIIDILLSKGFRDQSNPEEPEPAMALNMENAPEWPAPKPDCQVKRVRSQSELEVWCDIVNDVLFHWPLLPAEHYAPWLADDAIALYVAYRDGIPVSTTATIRDGDAASLEFVATLESHRRRGAATAACVEALRRLQESCVQVVTLRARHDGVHMYEKLGFKTYYTTTMLAWPAESGA
jgi:GNAT superfamily N-acetyltransferase